MRGALKRMLRRTYHASLDLLDGFQGRDELTPPRSMIFVGDGDFREIGQEFRDYFVRLGGLQPHERVLDVGCGIGRMAVPLTGYLSAAGEYWGFDVVEQGVEWCQEHVTPRFRNFQFFHADVYNKEYNPRGELPARQLRFPFDNGYFDFVFLTSVFTHMLPADLEHYLAQIARVLRPGGRCLITYFLLTDESLELIHAGRSTLDFHHPLEGCLIKNPKMPEAAVAYPMESVRQLYARHGLRITEPIHFGSWPGRPRYLSYQDIVVAVKDGGTAGG